MKIALLFPNNLFTSPYLKYYTSILNKENIAYDLIIWDRENIKEDDCIAFKSHDSKNAIISKTLNFFKFRKFILQQLKKADYTKVIVFTGQLGILLSDYLVNNYKYKYILDIRDYSNPMHYFKNRFKKLITNAQFVTISSNGFKEWLPNYEKYILSHNIDLELIHKRLSKKSQPRDLFNSDVIQVDTIGQIKDYDSDHRFVAELKNNPNFQMNFIGFGGTLDLLKEYSSQEKVKNISFHGKYKKEEEEGLLQNTDFINILISLEEFNKGATLLSNRLYLSALLHIPCIVNANSEQSRIIEKYNFGIVIRRYEELPEQLLIFQQKFNEENFIENCLVFLNDVKTEYDLFNQSLVQFLKS